MNTSESFESELISLGTTTIPTNTVEQSELCNNKINTKKLI